MSNFAVIKVIIKEIGHDAEIQPQNDKNVDETIAADEVS